MNLIEAAEEVIKTFCDNESGESDRRLAMIDLRRAIAAAKAVEPVYQWREKMTPLWEDCSEKM